MEVRCHLLVSDFFSRYCYTLGEESGGGEQGSQEFESSKLPAFSVSGIIQNDKESHNLWIFPSLFK